MQVWVHQRKSSQRTRKGSRVTSGIHCFSVPQEFPGMDFPKRLRCIPDICVTQLGPGLLGRFYSGVRDDVIPTWLSGDFLLHPSGHWRSGLRSCQLCLGRPLSGSTRSGCGEEGRKCSCCVPGVPRRAWHRKPFPSVLRSHDVGSGRSCTSSSWRAALQREPFPQQVSWAWLPH